MPFFVKYVLVYFRFPESDKRKSKDNEKNNQDRRKDCDKKAG